MYKSGLMELEAVVAIAKLGSAPQTIVDQQRQNRVITDIVWIIFGSGVLEKPANLFKARCPRNILERIKTRQFNTRREIGSTPSLTRGVAKKATQTTAERVH